MEAQLQPHRSRYWLNNDRAAEKTGIQALERAAPTRLMAPGRVERQEFEYIRHGTQTLIANLDVVSGKIVAPSIGPTRNESDFANHIAATIDTDPEVKWIFLLDQLNTHKFESLVLLVAERCGIDDDIGVKGKSGVLQSMPRRAAFLSDPSHRIRFIDYFNKTLAKPFRWTYAGRPLTV
jgi:hypothetical protein